MTARLTGKATRGRAQASQTLQPILHLIEARSGLLHLRPETFNVELVEPYVVVADFDIKKHEYCGTKVLLFKHCRVGDIPCLIMRPDIPVHGPEIIELMSSVYLRGQLGLSDGSVVVIDVD